MSDPDKLDFLWAVPSRGLVRVEWHMAASFVQNPTNTSVQQKFILENNVQDARNLAVRAMYDLDAEYLWFLDDDVLPPPSALKRMALLLEQRPEFSLVSAIVPTQGNDPEPCVYRGSRPGAYWGWTAGEPFEIDQCGMACCLIRRDTFDRLDEPWFTWERSNDTGGFHEVGEDIGFCERVRDVNGRLLADGATICGHISDEGTLYTLPGDCPPMKRGKDWVKTVTTPKHDVAVAA